MSHYRLTTQALGVGTLTAVDVLLPLTQADPYPVSYQEFAEVVDNDNLGIPIEAGLPRASWHWDWLPQADIQALLDICPSTSAAVYLRTRENSGLDYTFAIFTATMLRPRIGDPILSEFGPPIYPLPRGPVDVDFISLVLVP